MLPAKKLLLWHQGKQALQRLKEEWQREEAEAREAEQKVERLEARRSSIPAPANDDEQLALMLLEQELWMAKKEQEQLRELWEQTRSGLQQAIQQQQFDLLQMEQELDEAFLTVYFRLAETKENPIVEVRNRACMGCFLPLSMQKLQEWRRGSGVVVCDECERILV